jgi:hypothetical protein
VELYYNLALKIYVELFSIGGSDIFIYVALVKYHSFYIDFLT